MGIFATLISFLNQKQITLFQDIYALVYCESIITGKKQTDKKKKKTIKRK